MRLLVLVAAATVLGALVSGSASGAQAACTPGVKTVGGLSERVFCGPARATVHYGSKVFRFSQGECDRMASSFAINIGTVVLGTTKKAKPDYFGLVIGDAAGTKPARRDGAYVGGVLALDYGGKGYLVQGTTLKVTLSAGRSRGTFSGNTFLTSPTVKVTGTFSC